MANNLWFSRLSLRWYTAIDTIKKDYTFKVTIPPDEFGVSVTCSLILAKDTLIVSIHLKPNNPISIIVKNK